MGVGSMKVKTGYIYHIKDEFFDIVNDEKLMTNHERGKKRPTYFTIKDKDILWFIPLSSKVSKYKPIIERKIKKYGSCRSIMIREIAEEQSVILNAVGKINIWQIIDQKNKKYGRCDTILIREILGKDSVILLQNAFPTLEKYIDHVHLLNNGKPAKVVESLKNEILKNFKYLLKLKNNGVDLFFTDIDK